MARGDRPPSYLSSASLAEELDMSESTVAKLVKRGLLPGPVRMLGNVRWIWSEVEAALAALKNGADTPAQDPFLAGVANVAKTKESRRGAT
jgi:predicted DNA-binding transcriptional regulator AlpA